MRVMTWNVWWRHGDWAKRLPAIAAAIAEVDPDVLTLQEVWATAGDNLAKILAEEFGMHWTFSTRRDPKARGDDIGVAVLSRWPHAATAELLLPDPDSIDRPRTALAVEVESPGGIVPVITTHLPSRPHLSAMRCQQVTALAGFVAEVATDDAGRRHPHPPVLTGDFNAEPDSDEIRLLCGHKTAPAVPGQVLVDAWRYAEPGALADTWSTRNPNVAVTGSFGVRIDYVMVGWPAAGGRGLVTSVALAGDQFNRGCVALRPPGCGR